MTEKKIEERTAVQEHKANFETLQRAFENGDAESRFVNDGEKTSETF